MALPPDVIRINALWRRQRWCLRIGVAGFGAIAAGMGLGFAGLGMRFATVTCVTGGAVAIAALLVGVMIGAMINAASRRVTPERAAEAPLEAGEMFGEMRVEIADDRTLHLSMGRSPLRVGLHRFAACLALLGLSVALVVLFAIGHAWGSRPWLIAAGVVGAVAIARVPFAVQWVAGNVHNGSPGIVIQRVRWFFVRDTLTVGATDIVDLRLSERDILLTTASGTVITLVRTPPCALADWTTLRLMCRLDQALGREVPIVNDRHRLAVA